MGIDGLNPFLKEKCPDNFFQMTSSMLHGKRMVLDAESLLRRFMSSAHKAVVNMTDVTLHEPDREEIVKLWFTRTREFFVGLLKSGITPVVIFDGAYSQDKAATQKKRQESKQKKKDDAAKCKAEILALDILERTPAMVTKLRKHMANLSYIAREDKDTMINVLRAVGIPCLVATGEAEKLCAMLCREGKATVAYSKDTDLIAYGCPIAITDFGQYMYNPTTRSNDELFECTRFDGLLDGLGMTYATFVDFCIILGCDYNNRIKYFGPGKAYPILVDCKCIEGLPTKFHDRLHILNYEKCRGHFTYVPSGEICQGDLILSIDTTLENARDVLEMYSQDVWLSQIVPIYAKGFPHAPTSGFIPIPIEKPRLKINGLIYKPPPPPSSIQIKLNIVGSNGQPIAPIEPVQPKKKTPEKKVIAELNAKQLEMLKLKIPVRQVKIKN
jgi:5'-3' exonuclease